jgi:vacuolar iron transporter family protein
MAERNNLGPDMSQILIDAQRIRITQQHVYQRLAGMIDDEENKQVLERIADHELEHYHSWQEYVDQKVEPNRLKIKGYVWLAKILGLTFSVQLMRREEDRAQNMYKLVAARLPSARYLTEADEEKREDELIEMLEEESQHYVSSMVLGLDDALVEFAAELAALTLLLQNTRLIGAAGLVIGIVALLSMAASEYLAAEAEETGRNPLKAALYTGITAVFTLVLLVLPFFLVEGHLTALILTLIIATIIIFLFSFYVSVVKSLNFKRRFIQMVAVMLGMLSVTFVVVYIVHWFIEFGA